MSKKEEKSKEYSFNIPSEVYNTLETDADKLLWKTETERAFEAGWDAAIEKAALWFSDRYQSNGSYLNADDLDDYYKEMKEE